MLVQKEADFITDTVKFSQRRDCQLADYTEQTASLPPKRLSALARARRPTGVGRQHRREERCDFGTSAGHELGMDCARKNLNTEGQRFVRYLDSSLSSAFSYRSRDFFFSPPPTVQFQMKALLPHIMESA